MFILLTACGIVSYGQTAGFDYPIKPGSTEWKTTDNTLVRVKLCQLPDSILKESSTDRLFDICLRYPLLNDYMYANSPYQGLQTVIDMFNGLSEFINRNDVAKVWLTRYSSSRPEDVMKHSQLAEKGKFVTDFTVLELLVSNEKVLSKMTLEEKNSCLKALVDNSEVKNKYKDYYGLSGDATTAFVGKRILKTINSNTSENNSSDSTDVEKVKLRELFESKMLIVSPSTVYDALSDVKNYVKNLK